MCGDAANGEYEGIKLDNELQWKGEATTSESKLHLSDVLEMLIRLDQQDIFMNPVDDDSIVSDCTKVIKKPMCFLRMREKIHEGQYQTWLSFVEDFKSICLNAMKCNLPPSHIWNAASTMFRQGKRCLEQQFSKHTIVLGCNKMHKDQLHQENNAAEVHLNSTDPAVLPCKNPGERIPVTADKNCISRAKGKAGQMAGTESSSVNEVLALGNKLSPVQSSTEDARIEIVRDVPEKNSTVEFDDQATECSSSFSGIQSEWEDDSCTADSELRDGNGAHASSSDNAHTTTSKRKKRALDGDWKVCKQEIEWKCRWLELQIHRLQAESNKYRRVIQTAEIRKGQRQQHGSGARTSDMYTGTNVAMSRLLRRRLRRKAEGCEDSFLHMSSHPVFTIYEKHKQQDQEIPMTGDRFREENQKTSEFDDLDFDLENMYEDSFVFEMDSIEQYLWQIETLQMQITKLKEQLIICPTIADNATKLLSQLEASQSTARFSSRVHQPTGLSARSGIRDLKCQGGTPSSRRRNIDFDINNVISPEPLLANYVEPARHEFIETPHWRIITESATQDEVETSDEDTDDEVYEARHAHMQEQETLHQNDPLVLNKSRSLSTTKERPRSVFARRRSLARAASVDQQQSALPISFGYIPKRKRKERERTRRLSNFNGP